MPAVLDPSYVAHVRDQSNNRGSRRTRSDSAPGAPVARLTCFSDWPGHGDCAAIDICRSDEDGQRT